MTATDKQIRAQQRSARLMVWLAARSSRNTSFLDKLCRAIVVRATAVDPEKDFMRDELIDNDEGFDPDELERYQRGETV
ncbi:hypothetical protein [Pyruvatibacter sp.]|uniref:hypothetical protein n=1 Tax=Pyruvatibacter sp. TaxID=1981328 RepID=UPI0032EAA8A2